MVLKSVRMRHLQVLYRMLLTPKARSEEARRREHILNILLLGTIGLSFVAFVLTLVQVVLLGIVSAKSSLYITFGAVCVFAILLVLSRLGRRMVAKYLFIGVFMLFATYPIFKWGILLPQGILLYSLIIIMSGVLLGSRVAFWMAGVAAIVLIAMVNLQSARIVQFDLSWAAKEGTYKDAITFGVTFVIIALVSWLSNREIQHSLDRVRASEKALLQERNSLEVKVRQRTKELEKAQVEKILDLQRFAEFGRMSATLLHELASPLTAVSLNLEQLETQSRSKLIRHAREGIEHIEEYVEAARRQLRNESEIRVFDVKEEIERVVGLVETKAKAQRVGIELDLAEGLKLKGDSIRFNHIISNLLTNAIDAYDEMPDAPPKVVHVTSEHRGQTMHVIVEDHGCGIEPELLAHVFEPFYTTKGVVRGTGIGLAITKQAVEEAFQGKITVASDEKSGTQFVVKLPLI